jgi:sirohydrochlorin ferrochelatase
MTLVQVAPTRTAHPALAAISHGTSSPLGQRAVAALVAAVALRRPAVSVSGGFVDVQQPDVPSTLASVAHGQSAAVIPLLLSAGYHVHVDLRNELDDARDRATALGRALGPDDRLVSVLLARLAEAGIRKSDRIVLACAGSSDARAVADCHDIGSRLARELARPVQVGFISAASPRLEDAVELARRAAGGARVMISTYLLAPGYFADLAKATAADVVAEPLLRADRPVPAELVDLVLDRYDEAASSL